jgi:hypothetical protein
MYTQTPWMPPTPPKQSKWPAWRKVRYGLGALAIMSIIGRATYQPSAEAATWSDSATDDVWAFVDQLEKVNDELDADNYEGARQECIELKPLAQNLIDSAPNSESGEAIRKGSSIVVQAAEACADDDLGLAGSLFEEASPYFDEADDLVN